MTDPVETVAERTDLVAEECQGERVVELIVSGVERC